MKHFFYIICLACFSSFFSKASSNVIARPIAHPIALKGKLGGNGLIRNQPVEAYLYDTSVEVIFNIDLGNLNIEVINQTGDTAFQKKVDAKAGGTVTINTIGWEIGEYILVITDEEGEYLEGSFLID